MDSIEEKELSKSENESGSENDTKENEIDYYEVIETHHLDLVQTIDLERQYLFSYLRSNLVFDNEDCERINCGKTSQQKASCFLDVIQKKGENGMKHFINALQFEHPELYKKMTGKEPASKECGVPYMINTSGLERRALVERYERAMSELHSMTMICKSIEEKYSMLEKKLREAEDANRIYKYKNEELQETILKMHELRKISLSDGNENLLVQSEMQSKVMQTGFYASVLLHKLLESKEENDRMRNMLEVEKKQKEMAEQQLTNMKVKFDREKRNSKMLNDKIMNQNEHFKSDQKDVRELKLENSILKEEIEKLSVHLKEFQKYGGLLNVKYNAMSMERSQLKEIAFSYDEAKEKLLELHEKCIALQLDNDFLQRLNQRLQTDNTVFRGYYNTLSEELEKVRLDRINAWNAQQASMDKLDEARRAYDESLNSQMLFNSALETKYNDVCEQLGSVRALYEQTKEELVEARRGSLSLNEKRRQSLNFFNFKDGLSNALEKEKTDVKPVPEDENEIYKQSDKECSNITEDVKEPATSPIGQRTKELLDSLRRKALQDDPVTPSTATKSLSRLTFQEIGLAGYPNSFENFLFSNANLLTSQLEQGRYTRSQSQLNDFPNNTVDERMIKSNTRSLPSDPFLRSASVDDLLVFARQNLAGEESSHGSEAGVQRTLERKHSFKKRKQSIDEVKVERRYLDSIIKDSLTSDFPPSKIHSIALPAMQFRSRSLQTDDLSKDKEPEGRFRQRLTGHVDTADKYNWSKRRRSVSSPSPPFVCDGFKF